MAIIAKHTFANSFIVADDFMHHVRAARFSLVKNTKTGQITQKTQNVPNVHKKYQMSIKYTKCGQNMPTSSIARPSEIGTFGSKILYHLATPFHANILFHPSNANIMYERIATYRLSN
jgi:hypothetical protein